MLLKYLRVLRDRAADWGSTLRNRKLDLINDNKNKSTGCVTKIRTNFNKKNKSLRSRQKPENNDVNRMTQQSISNENTNSNSHHDNLNRNSINNLYILMNTFHSVSYHQSFLNSFSEHFLWLNRYFVSSNTSRHCTNITATQEGSNDWMWKYVFKLNNFTVQEYIQKNLKSHLRKEHSQEIRVIVQNKIANKSLSQYFEVHEEEFIARYKRCNVKLDIFYETNALMHHICFKNNKSLRSREESEDNDVNRMAQQSIVTENANTSFHYDDINRQAPQNQDQQRYEKEVADNSEYRMMQDAAAENMATHYESSSWHDLKNQEDQQRYYCPERISRGNLRRMLNAVVTASADCHLAVDAAVVVSAESDNRAPAPPDVDLPDAYVDRPFSGTPCHKAHIETACSRKITEAICGIDKKLHAPLKSILRKLLAIETIFNCSLCVFRLDVKTKDRSSLPAIVVIDRRYARATFGRRPRRKKFKGEHATSCNSEDKTWTYTSIVAAGLLLTIAIIDAHAIPSYAETLSYGPSLCPVNIELMRTHQYEYRCVSSYPTSDETSCHNIDRDKASCRNGSAGEY
ncbi:hypothetical protein ALC53_12719 [Atta colombica]|uniref:Uncharacterized protein n=1 Tax=Atta colombica TaxID=520822 RepID=A0A195AXR5_9HYME|nr:hypothetical protein ALC53_12719 [Atta colombica]